MAQPIQELMLIPCGYAAMVENAKFPVLVKDNPIPCYSRSDGQVTFTSRRVPLRTQVPGLDRGPENHDAGLRADRKNYEGGLSCLG